MGQTLIPAGIVMSGARRGGCGCAPSGTEGSELSANGLSQALQLLSRDIGAEMMAARESELGVVRAFMREALQRSKSGVVRHMRIVGRPGTGKTTIAAVCARECVGERVMYINCALGQSVSVPRAVRVLIVDEIDHLAPSLLDELMNDAEGCGRSILALSNSADVTRPVGETVALAPYTKAELVAIMKARLGPVDVVHPSALEFVAGRCERSGGDAREAIRMLRCSIELAMALSLMVVDVATVQRSAAARQDDGLGAVERVALLAIAERKKAPRKMPWWDLARQSRAPVGAAPPTDPELRDAFNRLVQRGIIGGTYTAPRLRIAANAACELAGVPA